MLYIDSLVAHLAILPVASLLFDISPKVDDV
jgi:hypothetical protein